MLRRGRHLARWQAGMDTVPEGAALLQRSDRTAQSKQPWCGGPEHVGARLRLGDLCTARRLSSAQGQAAVPAHREGSCAGWLPPPRTHLGHQRHSQVLPLRISCLRVTGSSA